jgi:hypothetical protein
VTLLGDHVGLLRRYVRQYFDGLTDDELHWEPVPDMWGIRLKSELRTPLPADLQGDYAFDGIRPDPPSPPLTTIAWRIGHMVSMAMSASDVLSGVEERDFPPIRYDAAGTLEIWRGALDDFVHAVRSLSDEQLASPIPAVSDDVTHAGWVSHIALEIAFHSAEVGTMRHLYREMHRS